MNLFLILIFIVCVLCILILFVVLSKDNVSKTSNKPLGNIGMINCGKYCGTDFECIRKCMDRYNYIHPLKLPVGSNMHTP